MTFTPPLQDGQKHGAFSAKKWRELQSEDALESNRKIRYFPRLLAISGANNDKLGMARAHRGIGFAFERMHAPGVQATMYLAVRHLRLANDLFPDDATSDEIARTYEQLGHAILKNRKNAKRSARDAFAQARIKYGSLKTWSGRRNEKRMTRLISQLSKEIALAQANNIDDTAAVSNGTGAQQN